MVDVFFRITLVCFESDASLEFNVYRQFSCGTCSFVCLFVNIPNNLMSVKECVYFSGYENALLWRYYGK